MTPPEAAQTERGRRLLDDLLRFYDQNRHMDSYPGYIDANVPSKWAKWKLGYGPGSASEFAEEEAIFNSADLRLATRRIQPAPRSQSSTEKETCLCVGSLGYFVMTFLIMIFIRVLIKINVVDPHRPTHLPNTEDVFWRNVGAQTSHTLPCVLSYGLKVCVPYLWT
jgi:hypothetical protein